ncbi:MAG: DUF4440 domain-containing protein [Acidobacteriota bacterium]
MKRCPTCNKTFSEEHLSFCVEDGTPLVNSESPADEATVVRSAPKDSSPISNQSGAPGSSGYQPPGSDAPPGSSNQGKRKVWPWIVAALAIVFVFVGLGIAMVWKIGNITRRYRDMERRSSFNVNSNSGTNSNSNLNSNSPNRNENNSTEEDTTPPPTDETEVLSNLTDLEHEWTVANINADTKKLDRILADDYVGTTEGKTQGKAEYLKTIKRDTAIQKWNFEDLNVTLKGDRATLMGTLRLDVKDEQGQIRPAAFRFTDKFVWRDRRWQATGSEVFPLKTDG